MNGNMTAPVKEGDELDVTIEAIGDKGDGIAKKDGFVLVIPGTKVNQRTRIKVVKVLRKVGFAEVVGDAVSSEETPEDEDLDAVAEEEMEESDEEQPEEELSEPVEDSEDFGEEIEE